MSATDAAGEAGADEPRRAWQSLTFRGTARFATDRIGRLLLVELVVGALVALAAVWFLQKDYQPVIAEAAQKMPDGAKIQDGKLAGIPETLLNESRFLAIAVTPEDSTDIGQSADVQIQFRKTNFRVGSVFRPDWGWEFEYGPDPVDLSRAALEPLWGAWHPVAFVASGAAAVVGLGLSWALLGLLYAAPAKALAWFADRQLSWLGAWKLCSAALMPGALLLVLAVVMYGCEAVDLVGLACFYAGHFVVGWIYVAGAIPFLERSLPAAPKNPFAGEA